MKNKRPSENPVSFRSHLVELDDGSKWKIFPGDLDITLHWGPETDVRAEQVEKEISSHALISAAGNAGSRDPRNEGVAGPRGQEVPQRGLTWASFTDSGVSGATVSSNRQMFFRGS